MSKCSTHVKNQERIIKFLFVGPHGGGTPAAKSAAASASPSSAVAKAEKLLRQASSACVPQVVIEALAANAATH